MSLQLEPVKSKAELKQFIWFQINLYKDSKFAAIPLYFDEYKTLSPESNPAFEFCEAAYWIVRKNGKVSGRIAAMINNQEPDKTLGRIGFFDFVDDEEVVDTLIGAATDWLRSKGKTRVHGPLGFTDMDRQGLLIEGFDQPGTMATQYNYPYYEKHFERLGFEKSVDWVEYRLIVGEQFPPKIAQLTEAIRKNYKIRPIRVTNKKQLLPYIPSVFALINEAYKDLYGYTALSQKQIDFYATNYFGFVQHELITLIGDEHGELIAVGICMPSFTRALQKAKGSLFPLGWYHMLRALKKNDTLDLYLVAIDPKWQNKGINAIMMEEIYNRAKAFGIKYAETNIELETNTKVRSMWKYIEKEQHKRRRCYIKAL